MQDFSSSDLLTMASIDPDDPECKSAFREFHKRYYQYVWKAAYIVARSLDRDNTYGVAMILSQNVFIDVHKNSSVFESKTEEEDQDIKFWLNGIIKNKAKQYIASNNKHKEHIVFMELMEEEPEVFEESCEENTVETYEKKLLNLALRTLTEKERSILLSYYNFYCDGKIRYVNKDVKEKLAQQFNVRVDSLKQIKKRALEKVTTYIENHKK